MSVEDIRHMIAADAAAGAIKRKAENSALASEEPEAKKMFAGEVSTIPASLLLDEGEGVLDNSKKGREIRLEQNRKAARESRRRKKVMIEELQRSVIFFSRANGTLKQQNDELSRLLLQAKTASSTNPDMERNAATIAGAPVTTPQALNTSQVRAVVDVKKVALEPGGLSSLEQQVQAQAVAAQALFESQGYPAAAARAAAQTMNVPPMQPGATMQAMANFQQAAAAAMQAAMQGMHGVSLQQMTAVAPGAANAAQAYTDTMTALAMQQAAAAHLGQQFLQSAFIANPMSWPPTAATGIEAKDYTLDA